MPLTILSTACPLELVPAIFSHITTHPNIYLELGYFIMCVPVQGRADLAFKRNPRLETTHNRQISAARARLKRHNPPATLPSSKTAKAANNCEVTALPLLMSCGPFSLTSQ
ncbi:hypothetical protein DFH29DRAFT_428592 [Suillus ampliporus]|nr:hypothetical protein DFH29DRAFT_428592 [Suillus ampliporus]